MANSYTAVPAIIPGNLTVSGNLTVAGTLGVTGVTTLGALNAGGTGVFGPFSVTGASTLAALTAAAITSNVDAGIKIGAAAPFVRLFKSPSGSGDISLNLGSDEATRDSAGVPAQMLALQSAVAGYVSRFINATGTSQDSALDRTIAQDGTIASHTGDTIETTLKTKLVPANTLGAHGSMVIEMLWNPTTQGGVASTFRVRFGPLVVASIPIATANAILSRTVVQAQSATNAQVASTLYLFATATVAYSQGNTAVDTTVDQNITVTFQGGAATDNWTLEWLRVHAMVGRTTTL